MSFNLSPETFICSQEQVEEMGMTIEQVIEGLNQRGVKFVDTGYDEELIGRRYLFYAHTSKVGVLPRILKKMYEERVRIKAEMKHETDPYHKNALDKHQYALKIILNSAYGAFGFNYFRLYKVEVADAITYFARRALDFAMENLAANGFEVVYGDTDSCFFIHNRRDVNEWLDRYNCTLKSTFIPRYNGGTLPEYEMLFLEYEKDMEVIYFGDSKKRYYGIERTTGEKYIRGLNIIRKDTPPFLKTKMNEITEQAVRGGLTLSTLLELRKEVESQPYETIGITKAFGKPFNQFKVKAAHVEGAKFANNILGTKITHKDTPFQFYIVSHCEDSLKSKDRHKTICLLPQDLHYIDDSELFEIDYTTYFDKQVTTQLKEFDHIPQVKDVLKAYKESLK
jgi:DNA polymerase elongation subunit (family B)